MAEILRVPTGNIEFTPQIHGQSLKLGSVQVGKTDIVRRFCVGVAPIILGTTVMVGLVFFTLHNFSFETILQSFHLIMYIGIAYGLFVISNTMFSSKKDLEETVWLFVIGIIIFIALLMTDRRFLLNGVIFFLTPLMIQHVEQLCLLLLMPVVINGICAFVLRPVLH